VLLRSLHLENILSFGPDGVDLELRPLNVLIGPNGSGKSNLIDVIGLLAAAPRDIQEPLRAGGGLQEWIWKGSRAADPRICVELDASGTPGPSYTLGLDAHSGNVRELMEWRGVVNGRRVTSGVRGFRRVLSWGDEREESRNENKLDVDQSLLSKPHLADGSVVVEAISGAFSEMMLYREWPCGRHAAIRRPQPTDARNDQLAPDGSNLGLVLSALRREPAVKDRLLTALRRLYEGITDFEVIVQGGAVQIFLHEGSRSIPATRFSDGTLRYLCLLAVLCHPTPPALVCLEEPELGLHPDILPGLADLMREASERMQLVVTTHSDILVDTLTDTPESIVVCEKDDRGTQLHRLDADKLRDWLHKYRLGELWISGELGGKRW
jgi:predicted ATPase